MSIKSTAIKPTSEVLGSNGTVVVSINDYGYTRIFKAAETFDDCRDIIPTQEIDLQSTGAMRLRDKLNEVFPQDTNLADVLSGAPTDMLLNELMKRDHENGIDVIPFKTDYQMYIDKYDNCPRVSDHSGTIIIIDNGENPVMESQSEVPIELPTDKFDFGQNE